MAALTLVHPARHARLTSPTMSGDFSTYCHHTQSQLLRHHLQHASGELGKAGDPGNPGLKEE